MFREKLNICWRIFATGFCFSVFGLGALTLVSTIFPLVAILNPSHIKKNLATRKTIQISFKIFVWLMSVMGLISVKTKNFDSAKNSKGQVIVANHPSLIDVVILISMLPQSDCIVKSSLGQNFFMKNVIKAAYILSSKDMEIFMKDCEKSLNDGNSLIIFPEGTRTVPGKKSKLSRGAAHIALHAKANILPIHISCIPPGLLKNQKWYDVADRALEYVLEVKPQINIQPYLENSASKHNAARQLTDEIQKVLEIA